MKGPAFLKSRIHIAVPAFLVLALGICTVGIAIDRSIIRNCTDSLKGGHVSINEQTKVAPGYVLAAPYIGDSYYDAPGEVNLMDMSGRVMHMWPTKYQTLYAILANSGNLFVAMTPSINQAGY